MKKFFALALIAGIGALLLAVEPASAQSEMSELAAEQATALNTAANWGKGIGGGLAAGLAVLGAGLGIGPIERLGIVGRRIERRDRIIFIHLRLFNVR